MAQMTASIFQPELLLFLFLVLFLFFLARRLGLRWWPAWLMRLLVAGLVLLSLLWPVLGLNPRQVAERQVMVIDLSDSLADETRRQTWQQAQEWQAGGENRLVVGYGAGAEPALPPVPGQPGPLPALDGRASHLDEALLLAGRLLADSPGRVILASDGLADQAAPVEEAVARLAQSGHRLDVMPLAPRPAENDLALGELSAPAALWAGTSFDLLVPVYGAELSGPARLRLQINGQETTVAAEPAGEDTYRFRVPPLPEGAERESRIATFQVTVSAADGATDPLPGNNSAFAVMQVFAPPRALLVTTGDQAEEESRPEAVSRFLQSLSQSGIQADVLPPEELPTNLEDLQNYRVILLHNLAAPQLSQEQMIALEVFASRLAGGVIFLGGRSSYTLGGYQDTLLEAMLPLKLEPPPRTERTPIVFELILDRSSSMRFGRSSGSDSSMDLAREAAMRSVETLSPEDYLGVLTFSDEFDWDFPIQPLSSEDGLTQALAAINRVEAFGGTRMFLAMQEGVVAIAGLPGDAPSVRHILILSDGQSTDGSEESFRLLAETARRFGATISTIALGVDADTEQMERIAQIGNGRFYAVRDASDLPRIMISESEASRSENVQAGDTTLEAGEAGHPVLSGISPQQLPRLGGYNALSSRVEDGAEDILVSSSFNDPVLSAWQYGLGRVVAWTGDIGEEWTGSWPAEDEAAFWSQVVRYALVDPALNPAQVQVQVEPDHLLVTAAIYTADGDPLNLADVSWIVADQSGARQSYRLAQTQAGLYQARFPRPADGAYRAVLVYAGEDGQQVEVPAPFAVNPPAEWLPPDPAAGSTNLAAWASAAAGQVTTMEAVLDPGSAQKTGWLDRISGEWWRLMAALVILWPLEIAIRRRWLPWK